MPSLEILDISRNKIKRLPSEPGSLVNLRVRSISFYDLFFRGLCSPAMVRSLCCDMHPLQYEDTDAKARGWLSSVRQSTQRDISPRQCKNIVEGSTTCRGVRQRRALYR